MLGEFFKKDFLRPPLALYLARDIFLPLDLFSLSKARSQEGEREGKGSLGKAGGGGSIPRSRIQWTLSSHVKRRRERMAADRRDR